MANVVTLEYRGKGDNLISQNNKVASSVDNMSKKTATASKSMSTSMKVAAGALLAQGASLAIRGITTFLKGMVSEAREAEQVSRSTAQGIKTIGASSWTSAAQVAALSERISQKIGVDDELIQTSANLLLTFKNVKNAVGENNDIFDRAVGAAQDLAAKGFGSADNAAKMLGKALNDPIKGINAMSRAGVTFTAGQKKQIAAMVESGNLLGAQKIIMKELEAQVGGTAAAVATSGDKMAVTWANFQEKLGTAVMPILDKLLTHLSGFLDWAGRHQGIVIAFAAITASIWLLNAALNANPIILIITLIAGLVAAVITLWHTNEGFRNFIIGAWNVIKTVISTVGNVIMLIFSKVKNTIGTVVQWIVDRWNWLKQRGNDTKYAIIVAFNAVINFFRNIPGWIKNALVGLWNIISWPFKKAWGIIKPVIEAIVNGVKNAIQLIKDLAGMAEPGGVLGSKGSRFGTDITDLPGFATGGVVSGPIGKPQLATVHGGEKITTPGQSGGAGQIIAIQVMPGADRGVAELINYLVRQKLITGVVTK